MQGLLDHLQRAGVQPSLTEEELAAVRFLDADLEAFVAEVNEKIVERELTQRARFFATIEKSPLTEEQARAVVCFDNRVQLLAAAGSGKTSVMVARAAYAVERGFVAPDRILALAFNKAAAEELQQRIDERFRVAGIDSTGVRASTFHSFCLNVIGQATGRKPRLASWLDHGGDLRVVMEIVDELRDRDTEFRYRWDLYRLLYANAPLDLTEDEPDGYAREVGTGYRTFGGEVVRSHGERMIADFLFLNGINYEYERQYPHKTADANFTQYQPDFYYPEIDVWHEHWALNRDGQPPAEFRGYAESMEWKRKIHAQYGTKLIESTWADVMFGNGLIKLEQELNEAGLVFDWNPDRPVNDEWAKPMKHEDLIRLIRTFMTHVKSNALTKENLEKRLAGQLGTLSGFRSRLFLDIYWPIHAEWQQRLAADDSVDFEDMLVQAASYLESGQVEPEYELILVDEFQDASRARARLVRGLVGRPGRFLLAVGDDWQAINRFAGADLSVMAEFESWFGKAQQLALTATFRCTQAICDVSRRFVSKNPHQFKKPMNAVRRERGGKVTVIRATNAASALASYLTDLSEKVSREEVKAPEGRRLSVYVLGRYGFERKAMPARLPSNLDVIFRTVHGSKGLEADYVIVPGMQTGVYGFPSSIADDPVLGLAMPHPEGFPHAEERRLLYVALTRARRQVVLITPAEAISPFAVELFDDPDVEVVGADLGEVAVCPKCRKGILATRTSNYGQFLGCSTFPKCDYTRNLSTTKAPCSVCKVGRMVRRHGKRGPFLGCTEYPACRNTQNL